MKSWLMTAGVVYALCLLPTPAAAERDQSSVRADGRPPALFLEAGKLRLVINGRAQVHVAFLAGDDARLSDGDAAEEAGFRMRRARLGVGATYKIFSIGLEVDLLESEGSALHEAFLAEDTKWTMASFGLVKVPLARTALISSEDAAFTEYGFGTRGLAPTQQLGATVGGKVWGGRIRLNVGFFNGLQRADTFTSGYLRIDPKEGARFGGFAFAARLDIDPLGVMSGGDHDIGHSQKPLLGIGGGVLLNRAETIQGLTFAADLAFKYKGFAFLAEYLQDSSKPAEEPTQSTGLTAEVTRRAVLVQAGYAPIKGWLDLGFRFEMVDENTEIEDEGDYFSLAGVVTGYFFEGYLKVQLFYQHRLERFGKVLENDVFLTSLEGRF